MLWDVFCRVVDNFGDIGVCWRLAADLASRGEQVRLWADDPSALTWMAPHGAPGVELVAWGIELPDLEPGDVVVEAFGCNPPPRFVQRMAARTVRPALAPTFPINAPPVWINLEYLSAEAAVERHHGLPSPQLAGAGKGLNKWFFYPGFGAGTGGLIREPGLAATQRAFDAAKWLRERGIEPRDGERRVSLFCYDNPALPGLLAALAQTPTLLLATAGHASRQVLHELGPGLKRGALRAVLLPLLAQPDFDAMLWSCDLNFVRGEDSFVRAQWAGKPFVWQIYPQQDGVHRVKLEAFLQRFAAPASADSSQDWLRLWRCWNGMAGRPSVPLDLQAWKQRCMDWRRDLCAQPDLTERLLRFVAERR